MKKILLGVACMAMTCFATSALAGNCERKTLATCEAQAPWGHEYEGGKVIPLKYSATVCHPDFNQLARKWFSYAIVTQRRLDEMVADLRAGRQWHEVVELNEGQPCGPRGFNEDQKMIVVIVSPCRIPGKNVILVSHPLTRADDGKTIMFTELDRALAF